MQKPLRCFRGNVYGHVTVVCRTKIPRCGKSAGVYGTEDCVISVDKVVCVNCRGALAAGDQKCLVRETQVEVTRVRVVQKVSYAEAVKKVEEDRARVRNPERIPVSRRFVSAQRDRP